MEAPTEVPEPTYLAFVSYKGGVGRSLAAASCANLLARGGSDVLLIDFDIEAPSLPGFYGMDSFADLRGAEVEATGTPLSKETGLVAWAVDRIEQQGLFVPRAPFARHVTPLPVSPPGSLRLLPAGPVCETLLMQLSHFRWQAWMRPRETEEPWARQLATELKTAITKLGPTPQFVLVDATAGLDAPGYRVLSDLSDQALFLVTDVEPGEAVVFEQLRSTYPGKMHVVASRIPLSWEETLRSLRASRLWSAYADEMLILRHDPQFSGEQRPSVPLSGGFEMKLDEESRDEPYQLTFDHVRMLAAVIGTDRLRSSVAANDTVARWVERALGEADKPEDYYKTFTLFGGTIFNPSDPERAANVSFRVTTIRRIFNDIWRRLEDHSNREGAFVDAGSEAGFRYGESLRQAMTREGDTLDNTLRRWCDEDSHVGFGELRVLIFDADSNSGTITIENAFLPPEARDDDPDEVLIGGASILFGYIRGVLRGLFDDPLGERTTVKLDWKSGDQASETGDSALITFSGGPDRGPLEPIG